MAKILVVDDEQDIRNIIVRLFRNEFDVFTASCLREAREILKNNNFEVVIIDRLLQDPDGREENGEDLLSCCDVGDSSCVLITGRATAEERAEMLDLGFLYVIMKPFEIKELTAVVRRAYRHYLTKIELEQAQAMSYAHVLQINPNSVRRLKEAAESFRVVAMQVAM